MIELFNLEQLINFDDDVVRQVLSDTAQIRLALICVKKGKEMEAHAVPFQLVMHCVKGSGVIIVGDREVKVSQNMAVPCEPGIAHGFRASNGDNLAILAFVAKCGQSA